MKKESLYEKIDFEIYCLMSKIREFKCFIRNYIKGDHNLRTGVKRGEYSDLDHKIENALFLAVEDYISRDAEDALSIVCYDSDEVHIEVKKKIIEILHFYRIELPELQKEESDLMRELYSHFSIEDICKNINREKSEEEIKKQNKLRDIEKTIFNKTQETLHKVIDVRPFLWS